MNTASLKQDYQERIVPALVKEFGYTTVMQCPKLEKIVLNQGLGEATADKKIIEVALQEMTIIAGQKVEEGTLSEILAKNEATDLEDAFFKLYSKYNPEK